MFKHWNSTQRKRNKLLCWKYCVAVGIVLLFVLLLNHISYYKHKHTHADQFYDNKDVESFISRIRDIPLWEPISMTNVSYKAIGKQIPSWLSQYEIVNLFNFYWLQNGAFVWHLQRMLDLKKNSKHRQRAFSQTFSDDHSQTNLHNYLLNRPEYGIIIDTAPDPIQPLFPSLPRASLPWNELCERYPWLNALYTNKRRVEILSSSPFRPLVTYALYDVTISRFNQIKHPEYLKQIHYDEIAFIFDSHRMMTTSTTSFITQILPRIIRLLALIPPNTIILLPYLHSRVYFSEYIDVLQERGLVNDTNRFINYDPTEIYHGHTVYSTSSPRYDLIMLNKILLGDKLNLRREFILLIRNNFDDYSFLEMTQTINQFEFPSGYEYLHIQEYRYDFDNLNETSYLFRQALIIISQHTDILSHMVWCLPGTHIIEVMKNNMTTDYYEMSLQLKLNYWLAMTKKTNQLDIVHFRNLMMKVFTDIDA